MIIKNWSPSLTIENLNIRLSSCGEILSSYTAGPKLYIEMADRKQAEKARDLLSKDPFSDLKVLLPDKPVHTVCETTLGSTRLL